MRLASSDDPQAAADEERTKAREGMAAHSERMRDYVSRDSQPASPPEGYRHTEEEVAATSRATSRLKIAAWEEEGLDLDLIRELVLSKLKDGADREGEAQSRRSGAAARQARRTSPRRRRRRRAG